MHTWQVGDEVWGLFFSIALQNYEAKLFGHVVRVDHHGSITVRRTKPDHAGRMLERPPMHGVFPSQQAADEYIAANPFSVGPQNG